MDFDALAGTPDAIWWRFLHRLDPVPGDFIRERDAAFEAGAPGGKTPGAGVLVALECDRRSGDPVFILNKRSAHVQQPGDLCCPGGRLDQRVDGIAARLYQWGIVPGARTQALREVLKSGNLEKELLFRILAGVLRESWEEMRLPPWKVEYLGAIPAHRMYSFTRVIFPVVGRVHPGWTEKPNWEVERILRLPLRVFFEPDAYCMCRINMPAVLQPQTGTDHWDVPCILVKDGEGEEVLWGATFKILLNAMVQVFDLRVEEMQPSRRIEKEMPEDYFTGKPLP